MDSLERSTHRARVVRSLVIATLFASVGLTAGLTVLLTPSKRVATSNRASVAPSQFSDAGFAGYVLRTSAVHRASATITVPPLYVGAIGNASSWIGIDAPTNHFLQVGVLENSYQTSLGPRALYIAFWSDTALGFFPHSLSPQLLANHGDQLRVSISQTSSGWDLEVDDLTSGRKASERTRFGSGVAFNEIDWTQEDPGQVNHPLGHAP